MARKHARICATLCPPAASATRSEERSTAALGRHTNRHTAVGSIAEPWDDAPVGTGLTRLDVLRRRLLFVWKTFDDTRLAAAQNYWMGRTAAFHARVDQRDEDDFEGGFLRSDAEPAELLVELTALDRAAWRAAGAVNAPPWRTKSYWCIRLPRARQSRATAQLQRLYTYVRHHAIIPTSVGIPQGPTKIQIRVEVERLARWSAAPDRIKVEAPSFADTAQLEPADWDGVATGVTLDRASVIKRAIDAAADAGVDVLVFPELTIVPDLREAAIRHLRLRCGEPTSAPAPSLIVLGSFHQQDANRVFNTTLLVNAQGEPVGARRRKRPAAHISHRKLAAAGDHEKPTGERIDVGDTLTVYVTPLGIVALAICKDYLDTRLSALWHSVAPDLVLVPSYGPGMNAHHSRAKDLHGQYGTISVIAHECHGSLHPQRGDRPPGAEPEESLVVGAHDQGARPRIEWRFCPCDGGTFGTWATFSGENIYIVGN